MVLVKAAGHELMVLDDATVILVQLFDYLINLNLFQLFLLSKFLHGIIACTNGGPLLNVQLVLDMTTNFIIVIPAQGPACWNLVIQLLERLPEFLRVNRARSVIIDSLEGLANALDVIVFQELAEQQ